MAAFNLRRKLVTGCIGPRGTSVWFNWIPRTKGPRRLFAKVLQSIFDPAPGDNIAKLKVEVIKHPQGSKP